MDARGGALIVIFYSRYRQLRALSHFVVFPHPLCHEGFLRFVITTSLWWISCALSAYSFTRALRELVSCCVMQIGCCNEAKNLRLWR